MFRLFVLMLMFVGGVAMAAEAPAKGPDVTATVKLPRKVFGADEELHFTVTFKNESARALAARNVENPMTWIIDFAQTGVQGTWRLTTRIEPLIREKVLFLEAGGSMDADVEFSGEVYHYSWNGPQDKAIAPVKDLRPGKYMMTVTATAPEFKSPRGEYEAWSGTIKSDPVEVEISEKKLWELGVSSKEVVKDGLSAKLMMPQTEVGDEELEFFVVLKNVGAEGLSLHDATWFWRWDIEFLEAGKSRGWKLEALFEAERVVSAKQLKPGEELKVRVLLNPARKSFHFAAIGEMLAMPRPVKWLPAGKYELKVGIPFEEDEAAAMKSWVGTISTESVAFEVKGK